MIFYFHLFMNCIETLVFNLAISTHAVQNQTEKMNVSIQTNLHFRHVLMGLRAWTPVMLASLVITSSLISWPMISINGYDILARRSIDLYTGQSGRTCIELLSTNC
jgi:hypothetical protein